MTREPETIVVRTVVAGDGVAELDVYAELEAGTLEAGALEAGFDEGVWKSGVSARCNDDEMTSEGQGRKICWYVRCSA